MVNAEQVVIDIIANDKATSLLENVRGKLIEINNLSNKYSEKISSINQNISNLNSKISDNIQIPKSEDINLPPVRPKVDVSDESIRDIPNKIQQKFRTDRSLTPKIPISVDTSNVSNSNSVTPKVESPLSVPNFTLIGSSYDPNIPNSTSGSGVGRQEPSAQVKGELVQRPDFSLIKQGYDDAVKSANNFGKQSQNALKSSYSSFHQLNNMMVVVGGTFNDLSTKIAGIFGVAGLSGMIQKMWEGASQRQQNMMYLMHQKGKEQATTYYNEIMDIVTQLPGDDTFLTNILNMASAMDKSLKLDNLKEAGTAITDYYMSATMKGENSYETQRDLRKYITTGDTRGMRNSVIASEIDLLKNRNTVLERTQALEQALKNTGFDGMSRYDSASNELEELKGHFQKSFADLGNIILSIVQPIMQFYNALDTVFGGRVSQLIIVMATAFVTLFSVIGGGLIIASSSFKMIETVTLAIEGLNFALSLNIEERGVLNTLLIMSIGKEKAEEIAVDGNVAAKMRSTVAEAKNVVARRLGIAVAEEEIVTNRALIGGIFAKIRAKIGEGVATGNSISMSISDIFWKWQNTDATLSEAISEEINTLAKSNNTVARMKNTVVKIRDWINTSRDTGAKIINTIVEWLSTESVFANTIGRVMNINAKIGEIGATLGLASAIGVLNAVMAPELIAILAIVGAVLLLVTAFEKLGEAFGWWSDFGSMFGAIADGIGRLWNAFMGSEVIQGIIQYFTDFVSVIQYVWESISGLFGAIFGWDESNTGTFDIVQSIIDIFGTLGEVVKWVWNILDDWSNSPLGIITWLNPLGILIFHLDEIGSLFEDIGDAINRFTQTTEFQTLMKEFGEVWNELQAPFQEIWSLIQEIIGLFGELFGGSEDPEGTGTEERINFLVEILRGLATIIRVVVIPAIRGIALVIRIVLTPLRIVLTVVREIIKAIQWASSVVDLFGIAWQIITTPLTIVQNILQGIGNMINTVSDAIKNSIIGKLLGWDKDDNGDKSGDSQVEGTRKSLYDRMKNRVSSSDMDIVTKHQILGELDKQNLTTNNVNNVRNLGRTYNNHNNQRQTVIHQHFSEGSMPIDARNMTKKEARKTFISAFGFNRAVGHNGVLR